MKVLILSFLLLLSAAVLSEPPAQGVSTGQSITTSVASLKNLNTLLVSAKNDSEIGILLPQKADVLETLFALLRSEMKVLSVEAADTKVLSLLKSRVKLNTEKGNVLAASRDKTKLAEYRVNALMMDYLHYLMDASQSYLSIDTIVDDSQALLLSSEALEKSLVLPDDMSETSISTQLKDNYHAFIVASHRYQDILKYAINDPRKIASVHWFQEFSLLSSISYINHFEIVRAINYRLAPANIDVGGVVLSFIIYFIVYFLSPFIFRYFNRLIESYMTGGNADESHEVLYYGIRQPAKVLLVFFGIYLGTYALFYKTDYRALLESGAFIVFSIIFIWLFFKIIDSFVLVQIQKLAASNIDLRKELFNLGVQAAKGLVIIFFLAMGLNHFGISLTAIMSTLGVGGLAFALAAKDTLSNLFGGVTILIDNVFKMGDWIKVGEQEGTVADIGLRSTTIRTFDNALITIPNSVISVSSVKNWNRRAVGRRIKLNVGVTYECDIQDLRQCVEDIRLMLRRHADIANPDHQHSRKTRNYRLSSKEDTQGIKSTQLVFVDKYSDYSIDIMVYCFSRTVDWEEWLSVKEDVLFNIADIVKNNRLEFA
ncbi:MAG: mechanosensitive ion channel family protein, partial [Methylococcales bacterium]|nr:mechanosensitive ion channel family protein [Methylococcales bacterium]